jgi:hypothetical protein
LVFEFDVRWKTGPALTDDSGRFFGNQGNSTSSHPPQFRRTGRLSFFSIFTNISKRLSTVFYLFSIKMAPENRKSTLYSGGKNAGR